jgi:hypothetical protein
MYKTLLFAFSCAALLTMSPTLMADTTSSGVLTVTATIDPSISLTFGSDASGLALSSGNATNTATLAFGNIRAYGYTPPSGVTQAVNASGSSATSFYVQTPFDVLVMKANSASADYSLTATLNSADGTNTWTIDGTAVVSGSPATIAPTGSYGTAASHALRVSVPFTNVSGSISNAINFVATAN